MNVFIAGLYAVVLWLSAFLYLSITGKPTFWFLLSSPLFISGLTIAICAFDYGVQGIRSVLRRRAMAVRAETD